MRISDDGRTAGYVTLDWSSLPGDDFEVQFEDSQGWVFAYRGPDTATTLTGLDDGTYRFRVRAAGDSAWSDTLEVEVRHHELGRAMGFFGTGAVMFGILLAALAWPVDGRERNR